MVAATVLVDLLVEILQVCQISREELLNDSGRCATYRIQRDKIVEYPKNLPIEKMLSSPHKHRASSSK